MPLRLHSCLGPAEGVVRRIPRERLQCILQLRHFRGIWAVGVLKEIQDISQYYLQEHCLYATFVPCSKRVSANIKSRTRIVPANGVYWFICREGPSFRMRPSWYHAQASNDLSRRSPQIEQQQGSLRVILPKRPEEHHLAAATSRHVSC
jgi:hypothetical protein